jgi:hypothetical protein
MGPREREEMRRRAQAKLEAMRERARRLRHRVLTGAAIGFAVLWMAIFTQMITGHDPALGPVAATVRPATKGGAAPEPRARFTGGSASDDDRGEEGGDGDEDGSSVVPIEEVGAPVEEVLETPPEEPEELEAATTGQS